MSNWIRRLGLLLIFALLASTNVMPLAQAKQASLSGTIRIDGSSTVFPITEAVAEEFQLLHPRVRVLVGVSGTGGGFNQFAVGETDIINASRPIKDSEAETAAENGVGYLELLVAYDGLSVVVNPANDWADSLTVEELKKIWEPGSPITKWSDVRPEWPDEEIRLYGPGTASGTFDYFTEVIVGEGGASRSDYTASEDDNTLVMGVAGDKYALGYFGYAYYVENEGKLKAIAVDNGNGPVLPSRETVENGTYEPLSRPMYLYVSEQSLTRPEVKAFVEFYLEEGPQLIPYVGYIPLPTAQYEEGLQSVRAVQ